MLPPVRYVSSSWLPGNRSRVVSSGGYLPLDRARVEIEGETDSERLFAFVLTRIDETGDTRARMLHAVATTALRRIVSMRSRRIALLVRILAAAGTRGRQGLPLSRLPGARAQRT